MKRQYVLLMLLWLSAVACRSYATTIQLELYNSYPLLNSDDLTPLAGNAAAGDLVQVILTGAGDAIDAPNQSGGASGNNSVLFTTHLGAGMPPNSPQGYLDAFPLDYNSSLVGDYIYARFWNGLTPGASTYYGNSSLFQLPAGNAFSLASLDFVPTTSSPHVTDQRFGPLSVIPEPSNLFLYGIALVGVYQWVRRNQFS